MKKFIFILLFLILFPHLYSNSIAIDYTINTPIGVWASEIHNGYGFSIGYEYNYKYINVNAGLSVKSFTTYNYLYRVNFITIPIGVSKNIYENGNFLFKIRLNGGISLIEKRIIENYERGINEFLSSDMFLLYRVNNNSFGIYTGLVKEKIFESKYYTYLGFSFIFNID